MVSSLKSYSSLALAALLSAAALSPGAEAFTPARFGARTAPLTPMSVLNKPQIEIEDMTTTEDSVASTPFQMEGNNNIIATGGLASQQQSGERYKAISLHAIDKVAEKHPQLTPHLRDVKLSGLVFPFKASPYYVDELIDWEAEDVRQDPFYRLVFPTLDMLKDEHREKLEKAYDAEDPANLMKVVADIRADLNPHPAGQKTLNAPKNDDLTGVQHKYSETVLVFPAAAQTCHAYCTYCFRWAQFIGDDELRFAQKEADSLFNYLDEHKEVSDILMTGGDPMIMRTKSLAQYLEPLTDPNFLPHIKNIRIGTRSLTFWPQRFTTDADANELIELMRRVREEGGRHMAIMAHLSHPRELSTDKVKTAIERIQKESYATIRSQSPVMSGINDDAEVWAQKWRDEVAMGIIPYYMFMARDTGAQAFFDVPLVKAQQIYSDALRNCSGLIRTARGPSMSCTPGKVEVTGVEEIMGVKAFVLRFLQCRDEGWIGRPFFAKYDDKAVWFDDLEPLDGMELPWDENGLPRPVPDTVW
uniref:Radical SAM core domain-containing protein n=1 Tax=Odontella aurita TaxID=265563 RepID=A0A6U6EBX6_9STRA|mmetsp:Transcript_25379/g.74707  ORF Transcript_25379/g.74707 Transcript_25379/m.74707 type:complete len:530 (+) Transcript_25379:150-1739(+)|eukprot:CAMPEP_0113538626 /NCGR_PEP_ID=MMETSP0015_2-20120614/7471_1 /TAXON_ID=2838 /ORGANISM="Odontella" /LENGTH=529 /DNA_ID=CAMNT_0000438223 /DNA_START=123 /DNA_END=1712 /DNA_ORIENTATION=- /assembly_acc=CAM_ASM_000160